MFCIYVFSDEDFVPVYVGKAKNLNRRVHYHLYRGRFISNTWFYKWLNKQVSDNKPFFIDILEEVNDANWQEREKYWINHIKENGYKLKNMTDGGDGNNNQVFSEECRRLKSLKLKGIPRPLDIRQKISKSHKGKKLSSITRQKLSDINKGRACTEEVKLKFSKPVLQYTYNKELINSFKSLTEACLYLNCKKSSLANAINRNKNSTFRGFIWKYKK